MGPPPGRLMMLPEWQSSRPPKRTLRPSVTSPMLGPLRSTSRAPCPGPQSASSSNTPLWRYCPGNCHASGAARVGHVPGGLPSTHSVAEPRKSVPLGSTCAAPGAAPASSLFCVETLEGSRYRSTQRLTISSLWASSSASRPSDSLGLRALNRRLQWRTPSGRPSSPGRPLEHASSSREHRGRRSTPCSLPSSSPSSAAPSIQAPPLSSSPWSWPRPQPV
mmetsp:Transcript_130573/g.354337  ORF Transcript_130573/g.354337 Transcript_130573/m.354337 type:complete len:220 (-) Transcript_130573:609-1268(-)